MFPIRTSIAIHETPGVVVGLILANVVVFLLQQSLPPDLAHEFILRNALVPANYSTGITLGALAALITNAFMHVGWWHLLLNMWVLWVFGRPLEQRLGGVRSQVLIVRAFPPNGPHPGHRRGPCQGHEDPGGPAHRGGDLHQVSAGIGLGKGGSRPVAVFRSPR